MNTAFGDSTGHEQGRYSADQLVAPGVDGTYDNPDTGAVYYYKWNADGSTNTYTSTTDDKWTAGSCEQT